MGETRTDWASWAVDIVINMAWVADIIVPMARWVEAVVDTVAGTHTQAVGWRSRALLLLLLLLLLWLIRRVVFFLSAKQAYHYGEVFNLQVTK